MENCSFLKWLVVTHCSCSNLSCLHMSLCDDILLLYAAFCRCMLIFPCYVHYFRFDVFFYLCAAVSFYVVMFLHFVLIFLAVFFLASSLFDPQSPPNNVRVACQALGLFRLPQKFCFVSASVFKFFKNS